jgi:hypothetical protein
MKAKPPSDTGVRWRWSPERLTERIDTRFSPSECLRLWRIARRKNATPGQVIRAAVREYLALHEDTEAA